ncbi:RHS repeat domain-containing protein [Streptomyces sp. NPDC059134]|uniref:RHS repeat domain-containing protein n=1 Tax=Streptomyces sp. NPDC059134 TaxID=3346738 RepID=UPI0036C38B6B
MGPQRPLPILATEYDSAWAIKQSYRYDPLGQPTATKTGAGALFYYHHDTQGSPVDVTGSTGTLHQRWAYDPYGTRVLNTTTSGALASTPSYTGARYETTTGNLDLHARQYNTATGRFTRPDPANRDQSAPYVSPYTYADNVPTLFTDPSGLTPADPNDRVDSSGEALGIFGDAFVDVLKSPFVFLGDAQIPSGTWAYFYVDDGIGLRQSVGLAVEQGKKIKPSEIVAPGRTLPNYTVAPGHDLRMMNGSITVSKDTLLSQILKPNMGPVHLAICRKHCDPRR